MEFERACKTHSKSAPTVTPGIQRTIILPGLKIADYNTKKENPIRKKFIYWADYNTQNENTIKKKIPLHPQLLLESHTTFLSYNTTLIAFSLLYNFHPVVIVLLEKDLQIWNMISIVVAHLSRKRVDSIATY